MEIENSTEKYIKVGFARKWSFVAALFAVGSHLGWFITSQIIGVAYPSFELNTMRFGTQICMCITVVCCNKQSIKPKGACDLITLILSSTAYAFSIITSYLGTLYLPAGNLDGVLASVFIFLNLLASIPKGRMNIFVTIAALFAITGAICIVQPDFLFQSSSGAVKPAECPCAAMIPGSQGEQCGLENGISVSNHPDIDIYRISIESDIMPYSINGTANISELSTDIFGQNMTIGKEKSRLSGNIFSDFLSDEAYGYFLTVTSAVLFFICIQINANRLLLVYHHSVISLWNGIFGALLSLVAMLATEELYFNTNVLCIVFLVIHCAFSSAVMIFCNIAWVHVPPEQYAILETIGLVLLFLAQSTFLRDIHPPHGNWPEICGAILIIGACVLEPLHLIGKKLCLKRKDVLKEAIPTEKTALLEHQNGVVKRV